MLAYIPARSGSKRIKNKNLSLIEGFTLLELAVIRALESGLNPIIVSSDSNEYLSSVRNNKRIIKYKRPTYVSEDETTICESLINDIYEILPNCTNENICIVQPTNPFTKIEDLNKACNQYISSPTGSLVSVIKLPFKNEEIFCKKNNSSKINYLDKDLTSQEIFFVDGNFVISNMKYITQNKVIWNYEKEFMPYYQDVSYTLDIDYQWMLSQAELLWGNWILVNNQTKYYEKYK